ncbi:MAG TPA: hypothetical protein VMU65_15840 [Candidatus Saccharimonadales bacterium]|jgi:hypothetical protein|nr:hypothetical protein [Candidatus Saccharimonadales bacterium]
MTGDTPEPTRPRRRCAACDGELRFSHREYAGKGTTAAVLRCVGCGDVVRDAPRAGAQATQRHRSKNHRDLEEGPPANPVLDPEIAARLLESTRDSS